MILLLGCALTAVLKAICILTVLLCGLISGVLQTLLEDQHYGVLILQIYAFFETLTTFIFAWNFSRHLTRWRMGLVACVGFANAAFVAYAAADAARLDLARACGVVVLAFTALGALPLLLLTALACYLAGYAAVCFLLFANKTYKSPPLQIVQSPLPILHVPAQLAGGGDRCCSIAPGSTNHFRRRSLAQDANQLADEQVATVVSCLTKRDYARLAMADYGAALEERGIELVPCPIVDYVRARRLTRSGSRRTCRRSTRSSARSSSASATGSASLSTATAARAGRGSSSPRRSRASRPR